MPAVFISGASRGLGLALVQTYAAAGWTAFGNARSAEPQEPVTGFVYAARPNATLSEAFLRRLGVERIDTLVLNAAIAGGPVGTPDAIDIDHLVEAVNVDALDSVRVLQAALPFLGKSDRPRVAMIISRAGLQKTMRGPGPIYYRVGKATQLALGLCLHPMLGSMGMTLRLISPGPIATRLGGARGRITAAESAGRIMRLIESAERDDPNVVVDYDGSPIVL